MTFRTRPAELLPRGTANKLLLAVCLLILAGILIAGLSPFTPHLKNQVRWLDGQNGLYFGEYASILSSAPLTLQGPPDGPASVELWMQPGLIDDSNTMLAFQTPESPLRFRIEQNGSALMLERQATGRYQQKTPKPIWIAGAMQQDVPILITVTASTQGTAVYLNGTQARFAPDFGLTRHDLTGGIVVGNSAVVNDSWSGMLRGVAIYNQELSAEQVQRNYEGWTRNSQPGALDETKAVAVYPFNERSGKIVHSLVPAGVNLYIPDYYLVLYPPLLQPFWKHWGWNWAFWKDGLINVCGFMPLGFFFCAYFSLSKPVGRAILMTIILGCAISFIIEGTQFYLPTRDSDSMDFINNTLGTALGAFCYRPRFVQDLLARFGVVSLQNRQPTPVSGEAAVREA